MPQVKKVKVDLEKQPAVICPGCECRYFKPLVKIRVLKPFVTGSSISQYVMQQFWECARCSTVLKLEGKNTEPVKTTQDLLK